MSIYQPCVDKMVASSEGKVTQEDAEKILREVVRQAKRKDAAATDEFSSDFLKRLLDEEFKSERIQKLQNKRAAAMDVVKQQNILSALENWKDKPDGLRAILTGDMSVGDGVGAGGMNSISAVREAMYQGEVGNMLARMHADNLLPLFQDKRNAREIMRELWKIGQKPDDAAQAKPAARPEFTQIAQIIHDTQSGLVTRANSAGAIIGHTPGYIMRQTHDMMAVRRAGGKMGATPEINDHNAQAWADFIEPKLDWEKIQKNEGLAPEERDKFLRAAWGALSSGVHLKPEVDASGAPGFTLKRGSAMKQAHRKLIFKDADSFADYNEKFGGHDLQGGVIGGIRAMSDQITMMEKMGPNAERNWQTIRDKVRGETREDFGNQRKWAALNRDWNYVSGASRIPENISMAKVGAAMRAAQTVSKVGSAMFSHTTDLVMTAMEHHYQGVNPLTGVLGHVTEMVGHVADKDKRNVAMRLGVGMEGYLAGLHGHIQDLRDFPGMASKAQGLFYKLNGEAYLSDAEQSAFTRMMSHRLAEMSDQSHNQLPPEVKRLFKLYDIKPEEWDELRRNTATLGETKYLLPDAAHGVSDEFAAGQAQIDHGIMSNRTMQMYRDGLESKLRNLFIDRANTAVLRPDGKTMSFWQGGAQAGTVEGELMRCVGQFKAYPTAMLTRVLSRDIYGREGMGNQIGAIVALGAATTIAGYASLCLRALASGLTPPDPTKPKVMMASMTRGGGLGLLTDYIFGEYGYGRGVLDQVAGPAIGAAVTKPLMMLSDLEQGKDIKKEMSDYVRENIPGQNLFYLKALFDYGVFNHINEMLNPGYLERYQKRLDKDRGQRFFIPPS